MGQHSSGLNCLSVHTDCTGHIMSTNKKILLVDDEPDKVFKRDLEVNAYSVDTHSNSKQALDNFKPNHY